MHIGRRYSWSEVMRWTLRDTVLIALIASLPGLLCVVGVPLPPVPWQPVAVLGTAVAFVTGFKSNAAYDRLWEARKVWGSILNDSRAFAIHLQNYVGAAHHDRVRATVRRHVAWLTSLRYQLRQKHPWENSSVANDRRYRERTYRIPEDDLDIDAALRPLLADEEWQTVQASRNRTVRLLQLHGRELQQLHDAGALDSYHHVDLARYVTAFVDNQGKVERIKNFPYPRQFATLNNGFVWLFIVVLPFAITAEMQKIGPTWGLLAIPLTTLVAWVFHTMDRIGSVSENPFEGSPNDVPITAMSRGIEIDMLELTGEVELPEPVGPQRSILM